ncbi:hypothetical protein M9H77_18180 [Catharanthus roseus]|uniref:Uncharacterized protein n=1 Tax=Catharanthus roseus TaxID=4058 RepID=A0ACC0B6P5_CATRO|nr:hypothetical protein M9H77_18180 [Catharanthus roseus]
MAKNSHDSFSFSRIYFNWKNKFEDFDDVKVLTYSSFSIVSIQPPKKKLSMIGVSKIPFEFIFGKNQSNFSGLGIKVVCTLFGYGRGHFYFTFQEDPKLNPAFLVDLVMPTSVLVKEMASGLVRTALDCERRREKKKHLDV